MTAANFEGRARFEDDGYGCKRLMGEVTRSDRMAHLHWSEGRGFSVNTKGSYWSPEDAERMQGEIAECLHFIAALKAESDALLAAHDARLNA